MANATAGDQVMVKKNPADAFGVTVCLRPQHCEVTHDGRLMRAGPLPAGCINIEAPGEVVCAKTADAWETVFFFLPATAIANVLERDDAPIAFETVEFVNPPADVDRRGLELASEIRDELSHGAPFVHLRAELIAQNLIIHLLRTHSSATELLSQRARRPTRGGLTPRQLRLVLDAMDSLEETQISLGMLAGIAGCSPSHLCRAFKQSTGTPAFTWMLRRRVERAKNLLRAPGASIAEVALAAGFAAQPQFTTAFKRITGLTPGAWRRANLR